MNAIEIWGLSKSFRGLYAVDNLNMTVPVGAIYGFIGENGSGKSTTEKLICGHLVPGKGSIKLFDRVLRIVHMEDNAKLKFKKCSLGMMQRIGIAMALLRDPALLVLDEPINGLDADGMRIMREVLTDITRDKGRTVLISSHILGELEKIATHYGIIRQGKMLEELSAKDLESRAKVFTSLKTQNMQGAFQFLRQKFPDVRAEDGYIRIYDVDDAEGIVGLLMQNGLPVSEISTSKIGLEEYYIDLMKERRA